MNKLAFVFPGQGAQKVGMGKDFYDNSILARKIYDHASDLLHMDMKKLCFEKNDMLDKTEYTQAAMVTTCLAIMDTVMERGIVPEVSAGLSLGEYCAISAAKGMSIEDAITLVRKRGILMENAVPNGIGAMAAVLGLDAITVEEIIGGVKKVSVANYNCPGQIVITGEREAVGKAGQELTKAGARRVVPLNVSGPFHSFMLKEAGDELGKALDCVSLNQLEIPYVSNVTGKYVYDIEKTKDLLKRQVYEPVRWQQCVEAMIDNGVDTFVEIGPGKTLTGFMRKINKNVLTYNIETWDDVDNVLLNFN